MSDTFTLAHLTDAHLPFHRGFRPAELLSKRGFSALNWIRKRRALHDPAVAAKLVQDIAHAAPDHIAMTGDAVNFGLPREYAAAAGWLASIGPAERVSFVPGNHEALTPGFEPGLTDAYGPFMTGDDGEVGAPYLRRRGPMALIGVSSAIATPPFRATGRVGPAAIAKLKALLAEARGAIRVVLIHHPPAGPCKPRRRLLDAPAVAAAIGEAGAELVLHGHNHRSQFGWIDGAAGRIPVLGAPSASIGPGGREDPAEWRRISLIDRGDHAQIDVERRRLGETGVGCAGLWSFRSPK